MEYFMRFGMEENPFLKNSKEILFENPEFKEVQMRLNYLLTTRGFGVLTGGSGKGKTTSIRVWSRNLNPSMYKVIYSSLSTLTVMEFYRTLVAGLGLEPQFRKSDNFKLIQSEIQRFSLEKRITPVIIIDEANHACTAVLNDLKMIFNFEMDSRDRAVVLLAGLPSLNHTLQLGIHEPLRQRITMNYNMDGFSKDESKEYILTKLRGVRCTRQVFDDNALEALANAANGVPRLLSKLANSCLLIAGAKGCDTVDSEIVMQAVSDCELV